MTINPPRKVRVALYLVALFVAPLAAYLRDEAVISGGLFALVMAYVALVNGLALANVTDTDRKWPRGMGVQGHDPSL